MKVKIELEVNVPDSMAPAQLEEWLEFEMGLIGMRERSPLDGKDIGDITKDYDITITR